ncbi:MAG TPA: hypothetical protein VFQ77_14605 [Pseudonocardiaceae bacterium]|jgi:hypothetical protein|nr:hypothetical protein [Pseudonocardiaceae bacterium]
MQRYANAPLDETELALACSARRIGADEDRGAAWNAFSRAGGGPGLFTTLEWIAVSDDVAETAGQFARHYRTSHHNIEVPDYLIAATVHHLGAELWTCDVEHSPMFPGLTAPY